MARRVLPPPPIEVRVTSRSVRTASVTSASSASRRHEARHRAGEAIGPLLDLAEGGKLRALAHQQLVHTLRPADAAEPVLAQVDPPLVPDHVGHRVGRDHLVAVGSIAEPRGQVDGRAEPVAVPLVGGTGVQPDPDPHGTDGPSRCRDPVLDRPGRADRGVGVVEHRHQAVAGGLHHGAAGRGDQLAEQAVVCRHGLGHGRGSSSHRLECVLEVGEQERPNVRRRRARRALARGHVRQRRPGRAPATRSGWSAGPGEVVALGAGGAGGRGDPERPERVDHHRHLLGAVASSERSRLPGCGPCTKPAGWNVIEPTPMPLPGPAHEVAVGVEEHLVGVDVGVVVRHLHRVGVEVERPGHERADDEARAGEGLVHRRRLVDAARRSARSRGSTKAHGYRQPSQPTTSNGWWRVHVAASARPRVRTSTGDVGPSSSPRAAARRGRGGRARSTARPRASWPRSVR